MLKNMVAIAAIFFAGAGNALALNNSAFVAQVVPTTMVVGTTYTVSVTLQNTGDTTWTSAARYRLGAQNPQETMRWGVARAYLPNPVAPGSAVTFTFNVVAPNTAGTYNFQWLMVQESGGGWFGPLTTNVAVTVTGINQAQYIYDEIGRLVEVVAPNGESARYAYSPAGDITSISRNLTTTVSIAEFTPNGGPTGTPVTIYGSGYSTTPASNTVKFNATNATVTAATATSLTTTVPVGATTGAISVTNANGTGTSLSSFTVGAITTAAPTITGFTPLSAVAGTAVTITGTGFQTAATANQVRFGTYAAQVSSANATTIVTAVPAGEASGKIYVTTPYGAATSAADFYAVPSGTLAADVEVKTRLTVGAASPTAITTTANGKKILLTFDGTQGQWVSLALTNGNFVGSITTTAYRLDGSVLSTKVTTNNDRLDMRLPASGTYTILLAPGATDKGTIHAQLKAAATGTLTVGASAAFSVAAGQMGIYSFDVAGGGLLNVTMSSVTIPGTTVVTVVLPDGSPIASTNATTSGGAISNLRLNAGATYGVLVQPGTSTGGSFTLSTAAGPDLRINTTPTVGAITLNQNGTYSIPVTFTVTNNGGSPALPSWGDGCYLSADGILGTTDAYIGSRARDTALAVGASYTVTITCQAEATTAPGAYTLFVKADGNGAGFYLDGGTLAESSETNNTNLVAVTLPARADLRINTAPTIGAITVNQDGSYSFAVTFTVTNNGGSPAQPYWHDVCYLSTGTVDLLDAADLLLTYADNYYAAPLLPTGSYVRTINCMTSTTTPSGAYRLYVKTDGGWNGLNYSTGGERLAETNENNNVSSAIINLPPRPDLNVTVPKIGTITKNANSSHTFQVTFTVTNAGGSPAPPYWNDVCYLSAGTVDLLDTADLMIGYADNYSAAALLPNTNYARTITCNTPAATAAGSYRVYVKADGGWNGANYSTIGERLAESNETNNAASIAVTLP